MLHVNRRQFVRSSAAVIAGVGAVGILDATLGAASELAIGNIIPAPDDSADWPRWRQQLDQWRAATRDSLHYDDTYYRRDEFAWTTSNFVCCFAMMCDLTFYAADANSYQVETFLDHGQREFGGFDSIVLWHAYPRIGFDQRNQFDFYRDMPGGLPGLRTLCRRMHDHNVSVFIDYNPWDTGTRREAKSDLETLVDFIEAIEADGIFLDTMQQARAFRKRLDLTRPGVVLESELALPLAAIAEHHMSWAQWFQDSAAPGVLRNKWFERRHMQHQIHRWDEDHTAELHTAWMNGSGMLVWENVFGSLKLWSARDRTILRGMSPIQRRFHHLFAGEDWTPLVPTEPHGVYANLWTNGALRLWTLVNRTDHTVSGTLRRVRRGQPEERYFDLIAGQEVSAAASPGGLQLTIPIHPRGVGAIVAGTDAALGPDFKTFLADQRQHNQQADFDPRTPTRVPSRKPIVRSKPYRISQPPAEMAVVNIDRTMAMRSTIRSRECGFFVAPYTYDAIGKHLQMVEQVRTVRLRPFAIDLTPVTNAQFARFLDSSGYQPRYRANFLRLWRDGKPPRSGTDHPVVYVDLGDARAYARWAGKRLPTDAEWQYAAAGPDQLAYPWGARMQPDCCNAGEHGTTTSVRAYPRGRSPFGCYDMCGNTWEWTARQYSDGRTRFCILKGGSWYRASGSHWYADGGPQPTHHAAKFLLMWPGLDRCATIGFRCVVDLS